MVEDTTRQQDDLDEHFKETVKRAVTKLVVKDEVEKPNMDDQNKTFRTRLVACWMLSNAALAISIENLNGLVNVKNAQSDADALQHKQNTYFAVILYSTFALAMVRFIGVSFFAGFFGSLCTDDVCVFLVPLLFLQKEFVQVLQEKLDGDYGVGCLDWHEAALRLFFSLF